ncbi:HSP20 family protein [Acrasis kona]|uniref:HSP20 family protein n=1 Tax=Acrasis kona TaxID=1008807 RepID=A0AAW2ZM86_9EUKA
MLYTDTTYFPPSLSRRRTSKASVFDEISKQQLELTTENTTIENRPASVRIMAHIPGLKPENVDVEVDGKYLIISGQIIREDEDHEEDVARRKREGIFYTQANTLERFVKKFILPSNVEVQRIDAGVSDNGRLIITLPKHIESF